MAKDGIIFIAIAQQFSALYYCFTLLATASQQRMKPKARYLNLNHKKI